MKYLIVTVLVTVAFGIVAVPNYLKVYDSYIQSQEVADEYRNKRTIHDSLTDELNGYTEKYTSETGFFTTDYELGERIALLPNAQISSIETINKDGSVSFVSDVSDLLYVGNNLDKVNYNLTCISVDDVVNSISEQKLPIKSISCDYSHGIVSIAVDSVSNMTGVSDTGIQSEGSQEDIQTGEYDETQGMNTQLEMPAPIGGTEVQ